MVLEVKLGYTNARDGNIPTYLHWWVMVSRWSPCHCRWGVLVLHLVDRHVSFMNNETENSQLCTHKPCKSAYQISVKDDQKVSIHVASLLVKVCRSVPSTRWGINPICMTRSPASQQRVCPLMPPFQQDSSPLGPLLFASLNRIGSISSNSAITLRMHSNLRWSSASRFLQRWH